MEQAPIAKRPKVASEERVVVTGGQGFFGAWIIAQLLREGAQVTLFDLRQDSHILEQVLSEDEIGRITMKFGDIADSSRLTEVIDTANPTAIIHLAGLQIPACKSNPVLGARVNIIGTLNVFETAKRLGEKNGGNPPVVVYASSAAVLGSRDDYDETNLPDDYHHHPRTIYGVYKLCNEGCARIYFQDHKIHSVGLRPLTCFGVGRELGLTSAPTKAIKAAVLGKKYPVQCKGVTGFSFVEDIARIFVGCTRAKLTGAHVFNIRGCVDTVENFIEIVKKVIPEAKDLIPVGGKEIPIMADVSEQGLVDLLSTVEGEYAIKQPFPMPLEDAIRRTAELFKKLHAEGRLADHDLNDYDQRVV